jgi:hypothetical protein
MEPALKRELHSALAAAGTCLKDWFLEHARQFLSERNQLRLPGLSDVDEQTPSTMLAAEETVPYKSAEPKKS